LAVLHLLRHLQVSAVIGRGRREKWLPWGKCRQTSIIGKGSIAPVPARRRLGLAGAVITEYPAEDRRYDQPEYERFWAAAVALDMPMSLHTATRRQGKSAAPATKRCATPAGSRPSSECRFEL